MNGVALSSGDDDSLEGSVVADIDESAVASCAQGSDSSDELMNAIDRVKINDFDLVEGSSEEGLGVRVSLQEESWCSRCVGNGGLNGSVYIGVGSVHVDESGSRAVECDHPGAIFRRVQVAVPSVLSDNVSVSVDLESSGSLQAVEIHVSGAVEVLHSVSSVASRDGDPLWLIALVAQLRQIDLVNSVIVDVSSEDVAEKILGKAQFAVSSVGEGVVQSLVLDVVRDALQDVKVSFEVGMSPNFVSPGKIIDVDGIFSDVDVLEILVGVGVEDSHLAVARSSIVDEDFSFFGEDDVTPHQSVDGNSFDDLVMFVVDDVDLVLGEYPPITVSVLIFVVVRMFAVCGGCESQKT